MSAILSEPERQIFRNRIDILPFSKRPHCGRRSTRYDCEMKRLSTALLFAFVTSCVTLPIPNVISNSAELEGLVGREVTLVGFWSKQHEATGIYFGKREYRDAPKHCVAVAPLLEAAHGSLVRVNGILEKSACSKELICLTVCQPYVLKNARALS